MTGFNDPYELTKIVAQHFGNIGKVIDFGCGTGLCGDELQKAGFKDIYGVDGSPDMLKVALSKEIYA